MIQKEDELSEAKENEKNPIIVGKGPHNRGSMPLRSAEMNEIHNPLDLKKHEFKNKANVNKHI